MQLRPAVQLVVKPYRQRKRLAGGEVRVYTIYRINLPREAVQRLGLEEDAEEPILAFILKPRWFHLFDWENPEVIEEVLPRLTEKERLELCATLAPEKACNGQKPHILLARPEELRELGLDPDRPVTLEDVVEAVRRRLAGTPRSGDGREAEVEVPRESAR